MQNTDQLLFTCESKKTLWNGKMLIGILAMLYGSFWFISR